MTAEDRERWDERYTSAESKLPGLPEHFQPFAKRFRRASTAIDIACGSGAASVWLAQQGVRVVGYDVSPVAIAQAEALAEQHGVAELCTFVVADFDDFAEGLPPGPPVDLVVCNMFRNNRLDRPIIERLEHKGTLAIAVLSEVGAEPGRFRAKPGELTDAFSLLKPIASGEGNGIAWLVARKRKDRSRAKQNYEAEKSVAVEVALAAGQADSASGL